MGGEPIFNYANNCPSKLIYAEEGQSQLKVICKACSLITRFQLISIVFDKISKVLTASKLVHELCSEILRL